MKPSELIKTKIPYNRGFYNIMPIENIPSVLKNGILSNNLAKRIDHKSVAMNIIQNKRDKVKIPNGLELHDYANLYFDARNPMMYKRKSEDIVVLKIDLSVLDLPDVIVSDQNASSEYARFYEPIDAIGHLPYGLIYAKDWTDSDIFQYYRKKSIKCSEVLVPNKIEPDYIIAAAVKNEKDKESITLLGFDRKIYIQPDIFFM